MVGLAHLACTADALCDALAVGGTERGGAQIFVSWIDDELYLVGVGWEGIGDGDGHLAADAIQRELLCRGAAADGEREGLAEGGTDGLHVHGAAVYGDACGACSDEAQVVRAVGQIEREGAELLHVARLVQDFRSAVKDVDVCERGAVLRLVIDRCFGRSLHRSGGLLEGANAEGDCLSGLWIVVVASRKKRDDRAEEESLFHVCR